MIGPREKDLQAKREARYLAALASVTKVQAVTENPPTVTKKAAGKRGRPRKAGALTPAQKQKAYRERLKNA